MKRQSLLDELWSQTYISEALEPSEEESVEDFHNVSFPAYIRKLAHEVELLDKKSQKAYEQDDPSAEELNSQFATKQEELENALSELEGEELEAGSEEKTGSRRARRTHETTCNHISPLV